MEKVGNPRARRFEHRLVFRCLYETLEGIAKKKKVSLAWVVREAVDNYIEAKWPLFLQGGLKGS